MTVHQCGTCQHYQRRGGIVLPATMECTAFDDEQIGPRTRLVTIAWARSLAQRNQCPVYSAWEIREDAYYSQDLPNAGE